MKKSIIISLIIFLILIAIVAPAQQNLWDRVLSGNILYINSGEKHRNSAITGWYPVEEWEVETCTRDVSASFEISDQSDAGVFSTTNLIVDTTMTIQSYQHNLENGQGLKEYEVAWYVHPFNKSITYEIQYFSDTWKSLDPPIKREAGATNGDRGYQTWEGDYNIEYVRIITDDDEFIEVEVVVE